MADAHAKNHDYHIVDPSPWPLIGGIGAFLMAIGGVVGAIIGSQLVFNISPIVLKRMFGVFIILAGINMSGDLANRVERSFDL